MRAKVLMVQLVCLQWPVLLRRYPRYGASSWAGRVGSGGFVEFGFGGVAEGEREGETRKQKSEIGREKAERTVLGVDLCGGEERSL